MKKKATIYLLLFFIILTSCTQTFNLSDEDKTWLVYKPGQVLVFESNLKEIDTIKCTGVDTLLRDDNTYSPLSNKYQEITVFGEYLKHKYPVELVELSKSEGGKTRLKLQSFPGDSWFYDLKGFSTDSLQQLKVKTVRIKNYIINDVYFLYPTDLFNTKLEKNYITKVYLSRRFGVIRFERHDGKYWEIKTFDGIRK